jgi:N-acetylglucosamine-6-sulfatase
MRRGGRYLAIVLPFAVAALSGPIGAGAATRPGRPNIVVIETDDQTLSMLNERTMPNVMRLFGERGTTFTDFVNEPLCCPSRAGLLTGQYPHNNGVVSNEPGYDLLRAKGNTLPVWLRRAGYRTGLVGKFLNQYAGRQPAPGFEYWFSLLRVRYFDTPVTVNGQRRRLGGTRGHGYLTNALRRRAIGFARRSADREPFFLWLAELAPHLGGGPHPPECPGAGAIPAPRDAGTLADEPLPSPPSFDEADVSDKPSFIADLPPLSAEEKQTMAGRYRCALESLAAVDRGVGRLTQALRARSELRRTVLIFTSDNGYLYGEHRMSRKANAYEEAVHLPLMIRIPRYLLGGATPPSTIGLPSAGVDLAPTILDLAKAKPCRRKGDCRVVDGRSLLPLVRGHTSNWPIDRGILVEVTEGASTESGACEVQAIRTPSHMYGEYPYVLDSGTGICVPSDDADLYALNTDPFQLDNVLSTDPQGSQVIRAKLEARLQALRRCSGTQGRHACE